MIGVNPLVESVVSNIFSLVWIFICIKDLLLFPNKALCALLKLPYVLNLSERKWKFDFLKILSKKVTSGIKKS